MEIHISPKLCKLIPNFKIGFIHFQNIEIGESPQMVKGRLQLFQESIYFDLEDKNVTDLDGIREWRKVFKIAGNDPNRYRHSAEALFRRIKKQNYLQPVNSAIDLNNFFSLQYQVPIGIYDLDNLKGNITVRQGEADEKYIGLNGRENSLYNLILTSDQEGAFGSTYIDSKRTSVTDKTKNAVQIIYLRPTMEVKEANHLVESLINMFIQIHGGIGNFKVISC